MYLKFCERCGKTFRIPPSLKEQRFCSLSCAYKARTKKTQVPNICQTCGKPFTKISQSETNFRKFCSLPCYWESRKNQRIPCEQCGELFHPHGTQRFCNPSCASAAQMLISPARKCEFCGKLFEPTLKYRDRQRYCNRTCSNRARKGIPKIPNLSKLCEYCNKPFVKRSPRETAKAQFCSKSCAGKAIRNTGHPSWNGGNRSYRGPNWHQQRRFARQRDNYICQRCNKSRADLGRLPDVHHIIPFQRFNGDYLAANQMENLITLCQSCHQIVERSIES